MVHDKLLWYLTLIFFDNSAEQIRELHKYKKVSRAIKIYVVHYKMYNLKIYTQMKLFYDNL